MGDPLFAVGAIALAMAMFLTVVAPPSLLVVPLGFVAVAGLSRSRRLGVLGAALLAVLAIPHGRAADNDLAILAGIPLRFHDGAITAAAVLAIPAIRRLAVRRRAAIVALLWLAVGAAACAIGLSEGNPVRDIVRDLRWWSLFGFLPLALWIGTRRPTLLRGLLLGTTLYAGLLVATALLPAFEGGLKARVLTYDSGLMRLQFNNGAFVVFAAVWLVHGLVHGRRLSTGLWFTLMVTAVLLSVTRMSVAVTAGLIVLTLLLAAARGVLHHGPAVALRRLALVTALVAIVGSAGVAGLLLVASPSQAGPGAAVNPIQRILFQDPTASFASIARGRGSTYVTAWEMIAERPLVGHGLGSLVEIGFSAGGTRPATPGLQPGVDNAYITIGVKAGVIAALGFAMLLGWPLVEAARRPRDRHRWRFAVAWLGVLALTVSQSFSTIGYGPMVVAMLIAVMILRPRGERGSTSAPYGGASPGSSGA